MNSAKIQGRIGDDLRHSNDALAIGKSYTSLHLNHNLESEKTSQELFFQKTTGDKLASTVLHAQKLRNWAAKAKYKSHELENELKAIDLFMFHPFEHLRIKWDMTVMIIMVYILIDIPYGVCFEVNVSLDHPYEIINLLVDIFLMVDIVFTFNTGFIENGNFITSRRRIAWHYVTGWFWVDLITSIPATYILAWAGMNVQGHGWSRLPKFLRLAKVFRMVKLLRVFKLYRAMSQWEDLNDSGFNIAVRVGKFLMTMFMMSHISACIFMGIAQLSRKDDGDGDFTNIDWHEDSWVVRSGFDGYGRGLTYLFSLYWAFTTLTTVGYGDILPLLPLEIGWTVLVMICGTSLFGFIIGNVASVMTHVDETAVLIQNKIQSVMAYMRYREFPPTLANKIRRHYEFSWKRSQVYNEEEILAELPTTVRTEVALFIHRETIMKVPFLKELGDDVVPMLVLKLKPILASPRDVITKEDYFGEEMYFVAEGELKMFLGGGKVKSHRPKKRQKSFREIIFPSIDQEDEIMREMEIHVGQIKKGDYFAEYSIILDFAKHPMSVRSLAYCDLFSMSKEDFEDISDHFPSVFDQVITVGKKRYLRLMRNLEQKRKWATAALVRGVALNIIEGEDAEHIIEPDGSPDDPVGFMARWQRRRSLQLQIQAKKKENQELELGGSEKKLEHGHHQKVAGVHGDKVSLSIEKKSLPLKKSSKSVLPAINSEASLQIDAKLEDSKWQSHSSILSAFSLSPKENFIAKKRRASANCTTEAKMKDVKEGCDDVEEGHNDAKEQHHGFKHKFFKNMTHKALTRKLIGIEMKDESELSQKREISIKHKLSMHPNLHLADVPHNLKEMIKSGTHKEHTLKSHHKSHPKESNPKPVVRKVDSTSISFEQQRLLDPKAQSGKLSIHMLAKIKMWKNRAVMNVALKNMASIEKRHHRKYKSRFRGARRQSGEDNISPTPPSRRTSSVLAASESSVRRVLQPVASQVEVLTQNQLLVEDRMRKLEEMLHDLTVSGEEANGSLSAMARLLGQIGKQHQVHVNSRTRYLCHMDSYCPSPNTQLGQGQNNDITTTSIPLQVDIGQTEMFSHKENVEKNEIPFPEVESDDSVRKLIDFVESDKKAS